MRTGAIATLLAAGALTVAPAAKADYAPLNRPGPALSESTADLAGSLTCTGDLARGTAEPVLLLSGTSVTSTENFAFNYMPALRAAGIPYCASDQPGALRTNLGDLQTRAEYVVYAIRKMYRLAGRPIATLGHSQGGMITRWALRFWPDTRPMVADVIGLAATNHGTQAPVANALCMSACWPGGLQQKATSHFIAALNSPPETFAGISYTEIYTRYDELVEPAFGSKPAATVHGSGDIANILMQSICPTDTSDHLFIVNSPLAYALALDAITHPGPADPARINRGVCRQSTIPGTDPVTSRTDILAAALDFAVNAAQGKSAAVEPPLRCYVTASCPSKADTAHRHHHKPRSPHGKRHHH